MGHGDQFGAVIDQGLQGRDIDLAAGIVGGHDNLDTAPLDGLEQGDEVRGVFGHHRDDVVAGLHVLGQAIKRLAPRNGGVFHHGNLVGRAVQHARDGTRRSPAAWARQLPLRHNRRSWLQDRGARAGRRARAWA